MLPIDRCPEAPTASVSLEAVATNVLPSPRSTWDYAHLRECNRLDGILPMGHKWIAGLPSSVQPLRLAMQYPRLVNLIAVEWNNPPVAGTLLTDLLDDDRGDRGFPAAVFAELRGLHNHYFNRLLLNG